MVLDPLLVRIAVGLALVFVLWRLFRFSMGLRYSKIVREETRRAEEDRGRRVVAEIPLKSGELVLFLEDAASFHWGSETTRKAELAGARLLLSGALVNTATRGGTLPELPVASEDEGREHWQVLLYRNAGGPQVVDCGSLREGVSREIATRVFDAVRATLTASILI
jgi:hypothetical protein